MCHEVVVERVQAVQQAARRLVADGTVGAVADGARQTFEGVEVLHPALPFKDTVEDEGHLMQPHAARHALAAALGYAQG